MTEETDKSDPLVLSAEATVLRFSPIAPDALLKKAALEFRKCGAYRLSVFAALAREDEGEAAVVQRILDASELQGVGVENNKRFYFLARAGELYDLGYPLFKYGFKGEIPEHYSVDLGKSATIEDTERISELFTPRKRRDE